MKYILNGVTQIYDWGKSPHDGGYYDSDPLVPIMWLSPPTYYVEYDAQYLAYGNEASLSNVYGPVCLVAKVGPASQRETEGD